MPIFKLTSKLKLSDGSLKEVFVEADGRSACLFTLGDDDSIGSIHYSLEDTALKISKISGDHLEIDTAIFVETAIKVSSLNKKQGRVHIFPDFSTVSNRGDHYIKFQPIAPALYREGFRVSLERDMSLRFGTSGNDALDILHTYLQEKSLRDKSDVTISSVRLVLQQKLSRRSWIFDDLKEVVRERMKLDKIDDDTLLDNLKVDDFFVYGERNQLLAQLATHPEEEKSYTVLDNPKPMYIPDDILQQKIKEWGEIVPLTEKDLEKLQGNPPNKMKHYTLPARRSDLSSVVAKECSASFFSVKVSVDCEVKKLSEVKEIKAELDTKQLLILIADNIRRIEPNQFLPLDDAETLDAITRTTQRFALGIYQRLLEQYGDVSEVNILSLGCGYSVIELIASKSIFQLLNPKITVNFVGVDNGQKVNDAMCESLKNFKGVQLITADATCTKKLTDVLKPNSFDIVVCRHPNILWQPEIFGPITTKTAPYFAKKGKNFAIFSCYNEDEFCSLAKLARKKVLHKKTEIIDSNNHKEMQQVEQIEFTPDQFMLLSQLNTEYRPILENDHKRFFVEEKSSSDKTHQVRFFGATGIDKDSLELDESQYEYAAELACEIGSNVKIDGDAVTINRDWVSHLDDRALDELSCGLGISFQLRA